MVRYQRKLYSIRRRAPPRRSCCVNTLLVLAVAMIAVFGCAATWLTVVPSQRDYALACACGFSSLFSCGDGLGDGIGLRETVTTPQIAGEARRVKHTFDALQLPCPSCSADSLAATVDVRIGINVSTKACSPDGVSESPPVVFVVARWLDSEGAPCGGRTFVTVDSECSSGGAEQLLPVNATCSRALQLVLETKADGGSVVVTARLERRSMLGVAFAAIVRVSNFVADDVRALRDAAAASSLWQSMSGLLPTSNKSQSSGTPDDAPATAAVPPHPAAPGTIVSSDDAAAMAPHRRHAAGAPATTEASPLGVRAQKFTLQRGFMFSRTWGAFFAWLFIVPASLTCVCWCANNNMRDVEKGGLSEGCMSCCVVAFTAFWALFILPMLFLVLFGVSPWSEAEWVATHPSVSATLGFCGALDQKYDPPLTMQISPSEVAFPYVNDDGKTLFHIATEAGAEEDNVCLASFAAATQAYLRKASGGGAEGPTAYARLLLSYCELEAHESSVAVAQIIPAVCDLDAVEAELLEAAARDGGVVEAAVRATVRDTLQLPVLDFGASEKVSRATRIVLTALTAAGYRGLIALSQFARTGTDAQVARLTTEIRYALMGNKGKEDSRKNPVCSGGLCATVATVVVDHLLSAAPLAEKRLQTEVDSRMTALRAEFPSIVEATAQRRRYFESVNALVGVSDGAAGDEEGGRDTGATGGALAAVPPTGALSAAVGSDRFPALVTIPRGADSDIVGVRLSLAPEEGPDGKQEPIVQLLLFFLQDRSLSSVGWVLGRTAAVAAPAVGVLGVAVRLVYGGLGGCDSRSVFWNVCGGAAMFVGGLVALVAVVLGGSQFLLTAANVSPQAEAEVAISNWAYPCIAARRYQFPPAALQTYRPDLTVPEASDAHSAALFGARGAELAVIPHVRPASDGGGTLFHVAAETVSDAGRSCAMAMARDAHRWLMRTLERTTGERRPFRSFVEYMDAFCDIKDERGRSLHTVSREVAGLEELCSLRAWVDWETRDAEDAEHPVHTTVADTIGYLFEAKNLKDVTACAMACLTAQNLVYLTDFESLFAEGNAASAAATSTLATCLSAGYVQRMLLPDGNGGSTFYTHTLVVCGSENSWPCGELAGNLLAKLEHAVPAELKRLRDHIMAEISDIDFADD